MDVAGKVALVTGGGSGIGRASAQMLAAAGAHVVVADVDEAGGGETIDLIHGDGRSAQFKAVDVSRPEVLQAAFDEIVAEHGAIHVVHNNAGLVGGYPDFPQMSPARIATVVGVNVTGTFVGTQLAIAAMGKTGGGAVINMSSMLALAHGSHGDPVYCATKAAIKLFSELLAPFAESHGVRVNVLLPGGVDTGIADKTGRDGPAEWLQGRMDEVEQMAPEEIAEIVLELVRDDSRAGEAIVIPSRIKPRS